MHCGQRLIKKAKKKQAEIEAALEIQQQQVKIINEQNTNENNLKDQVASGETPQEDLKQIMKLKNKLNDNLKLVILNNDEIEVSSNNL